MVTIHDIRQGIRALELSSHPVCVHSSLRSFGYVEGGVETVIDGLLAEGCTLLVPTFSHRGMSPAPTRRIEQNAFEPDAFMWSTDAEPYDPASNDLDREAMGAIPAAVLGMEGRKRGGHPLCSFTAVGPLADEMIRGQAPFDVYAPLDALAHMGGWIILMGVGLNKMTFIHHAEQKAGRNLFIRWAWDQDGRVIEAQAGGASHGFPKLEPYLEPVARETRVGESLWKAFPARESLDILARTIREHPEITHCGSPDCVRCNDAVKGGPIM